MNYREVEEDFLELIHNLEDDLELDIENGENGYTSYKESYKAIQKYTLKVLLKKHKKYIKLRKKHE